MNDTRPADFTIFAHVYYPDIWEEIVESLDTVVQQPFDLVLTRPAGSRAVAQPRSPYLRFSTELEVENRGRDILPFLTSLSRGLARPFEIGLKLHTKRSPHRSDGDSWRRFLVDSLLERESDQQLSGYRLLASEARIGLVAPRAHLLPLGGRTSINEDIMERTLLRAGQNFSPASLEASRFPAGSMFWFRRLAFRPMLETDFSDMFVGEGGQLDGTAAHAFERLFAFLVENEGFVAAGMENCRPILDHTGGPLSRQQLLDLIEGSIERDNPFSLPLAMFWRRYPALLKLAHATYARLPKNAVRLLRRTMGR